ncbi:SIS domain-containing protein [Salinibacterium sp. UTAS2018]|uniref:6-phospho-3-hexuloisomerase n=1 Tax=Salinibacterium sp. UTAS2018 TaxID=2508880 RepID=UPI0010095174|nr:6-phospho-3-hexuloisomerase [Salinibacterium sp. UTAS2018]QAV71156.1 SIS domain-containing protein [Salinibacterium sp. UTAS2018]
MANVSSPSTISDALPLVLAENAAMGTAIVDDSAPAVDSAIALMSSANRVFVLGAGRSGLALRMFAMRLMHLGLTVHVVGEVTTPAIAAGDVLFTASGSGTTAGVVRSATTAVTEGAQVVAVTTDPTSALATIATVSITIPAAQKQDHAATLTAQYSGGLFEQAVLLLGDSMFHVMWKNSGATAEELWPRHANLE